MAHLYNNLTRIWVNLLQICLMYVELISVESDTVDITAFQASVPSNSWVKYVYFGSITSTKM